MEITPVDKYGFISDFIKKHGCSFKGVGGQGTCWLYKNDTIEMSYSSFMKTSSFIIIKDNVKTLKMIKYSSKNEIVTQVGLLSSLDEFYENIFNESQIKNFLLMGNSK